MGNLVRDRTATVDWARMAEQSPAAGRLPVVAAVVKPLPIVPRFESRIG
jgi:hypothetical protein